MTSKNAALDLSGKRVDRVTMAGSYLNKIIDIGPHLDWKLKSICQKVLEVQAFYTCPASTGKHHCYTGGLVIHTAEVMKNALVLATSEAAGHVRLDVLTVAALFHDFCKVFEYETSAPEGVYTATARPYRSLIYHVAGSYAAFVSLCDRHEFDDSEKRDAIGHCLLAHHGQPEWGSCREPQTKEALMLHSADMQSAHFGLEKNGLLLT